MVNIQKQSQNLNTPPQTRTHITNTFPIHVHNSFFTGGVNPKKKQSKEKKRQHRKAPLTRKERMRQQIRERTLQSKAAIIEVCVFLFVHIFVLS